MIRLAKLINLLIINILHKTPRFVTAAPSYLRLHEGNNANKALFAARDLMLISLDNWKRALETCSVWLSDTPSVMIMKP